VLVSKVDRSQFSEGKMAQALTISFVGVDKFTIAHNNQTTAELPFVDPLTREDWEDIQTVEDALAINRTLDPAAAEIWKTYNILARIATAQGKTPSAQAYRQQARSAKAAFAGTQYELQQHEPLITVVVTAMADQSAAEQLETLLTNRNENGWGQLVAVIRRILAGERSIKALWDDLDADDSMIIQAIIDRLS
jgi:Trp operon repressor